MSSLYLDAIKIVLPVPELDLGTRLMQLCVSLYDQLRLLIEPRLEKFNFFDYASLYLWHSVSNGVSFSQFILVFGIQVLRLRRVAHF